MKVTKLTVYSLLLGLVLVLAFPAVAAACDPGNGDGICGPGDGDTIMLTGTIRDFNSNHSDFDVVPFGGFHLQTGLVENMLDTDGKPVFTSIPGGGISSTASFSQWYRDVEGVNSSKPYSLPFTETTTGSGIYVFHTIPAGSFFPIDDWEESVGYEEDVGWDGQPHNFLFTLELNAYVTYQAGGNQTFKFRSDDDIWVFIDGNLVVDLGGVHYFSYIGEVNLDDVAASLGLTDGQTYNLDIFFAERHTVHSQLDACGPVAPVPELPTIVLFGLGLFIMVGFIWKRKHSAVVKRRRPSVPY